MSSLRGVQYIAYGTVLLALATPALVAQDAPPSAWARAHDASAVTNSTRVSWLGAWSPLRPIADIARGELRAPFGPGVLDAPSPLSGPFILAGAPGAIVRDLKPHSDSAVTRFNELRIQRASESGAFHRPLDVVRSSATQVSGMGWSPVGARGIAMGRFVVDQEQEDTSSFTQRPSPSWSSPFVATDSVRPPMVRTRARVEGALGLRLGEFGIGLSAGVDSREQNTLDFPLRRTGRWASPSTMFGAERTLPWANARVGVYSRWSEMSETNILNPSPLNTVIYTVQGFDEPQGIPVVNATLFVRSDRRATSNGVTMSFNTHGTTVVAVYERGQRADDQYRLITARARPTDSWRADASETRVQLQRMFGSRLSTTVVAHHITMDGTGTRNDLSGLAISGSDAQSAIEADARLTLGNWKVGVLGGLQRRSMDRQDFVAEITASVEKTVPFISAEVARQVGTFAMSAGASAATAAPTASLPPADRGPNYQRLIAPDLAYDAAKASATAAWVTVQHPFRGQHLFARLRFDQASASSVLTERLQPGGDRHRWQLNAGYRAALVR